MRVAVAGGTGVAGRHVVETLEKAGHETVVLARSLGVDVATGEGLLEALEGVSTVVDCSNVSTMKASESERFFGAVTRNLLTSGRAAGVGHFVALSIVGIDRVDFGYYRGKVAQEALLLADDRPSSVLRATQFHEFAGQLLDRSRGPLVVVPRMRVQPVSAREVGEALAELAVGEPVGMAPELAGPREEDMVDLVRQMAKVRPQRRFVMAIKLPGAAGKAMTRGGLLPEGDGPRGEQTFAQYLAGLS
ncbi:MAG TPA: NAD-dependent epimerase/dehydratase family protein [Frankiaceae bacterium]|jgi:uncharacterized protein YbjT (DUF2867 family)|nr:NAD-dependent epimerase/dehydratase family protein [Frankiaceae bacterium]